VKEQSEIIAAISDAVSAAAPQVREAMNAHQGFDDIGKRMLTAWHEGVSGLREKH
jgi:serine/threonine-protein kinase HipA